MTSLNFSPFPLLTTTRLVLRPLNQEDAPVIYALRSDPQVNQFLDRPKADSIADAIAFIEKIQQKIQDNEALFWGINRKDDPTLVGSLGLFNFLPQAGKAEIGYELLPQHQGQGIMQEALGQVLAYGFATLGLTSLDAWVEDANHPSLKLLDKFHFERNLETEPPVDDPPVHPSLKRYTLSRALFESP